MTDRDAFIQATVVAPSDDAPRLVFQDWLDETEGMEIAALNWRWYWFDLIPRLRRLPPLLKDRDKKWDRPNRLYMPLLLNQKFKPIRLRQLWATAAVRTFVDQSGTPIWDRVNNNIKTFISAYETCLITKPIPINNITTSFDTTQEDPNFDLVLTTVVDTDEPMHVHATAPTEIGYYAGGPDRAGFAVGTTTHDMQDFCRTLEGCLRGWDERFLMAPFTPEDHTLCKYPSTDLYPGWITESLRIFLTGYDRLKKARKVLEPA